MKTKKFLIFNQLFQRRVQVSYKEFLINKKVLMANILTLLRMLSLSFMRVTVYIVKHICIKTANAIIQKIFRLNWVPGRKI